MAILLEPPITVSATSLFVGDKILSFGLVVSYIPPKVAIPTVARPTPAILVSRLP
jgi:hypothetical protein